MATKPDFTLILIARMGVVRADFDKRGTLNSILRETLDVEAGTADSVKTVIQGHPLPAPRTVVLSTEVWSQPVLLPRQSVAGIESEELRNVLKFEAETLTGIEIDEISLAYSELGRVDDYEQYWVSVIGQSELNEVNALLETSGCREFSIAHPAGLARDTKADSGDLSIESWDSSTYLLSDQASKLVKQKQTSPEEFESDATRLTGSELSPSVRESFSLAWDLLDDDEFTEWASLVADNLRSGEEGLLAPRIQMARPDSVTPVRHVLSVAIALIAVAFCFWHWNYMKQEQRTLKKRIEEIKKPAEAKKKFDSQLIAIIENRAEVENQDAKLGDDLKQVQFFLENQSNRIAQLMNLLVVERTPDMVINKISGTEEGLTFSGISVNGESAQALAKRLREAATPLGWVVNPAKQVGQEKLTTGGPWNYEIILTDTGPFETSVQARKKVASQGK